MARVGTCNFFGRDGTENLINQQQHWWRQTVNKEFYKHPYNSLKVVVPQPSYHGLASTSHESFAKPWHVMSDASGQQRFPRAGKHSFYYEGGDTTTPIFPFEQYTMMRPPREKWGSGEIGEMMGSEHNRPVTPVTQRTGRSRSSISIRTGRDVRDADFIPDVARDDGSLDPSSQRNRSSRQGSARSGQFGDGLAYGAGPNMPGHYPSARSYASDARSMRSHRSGRSGMSRRSNSVPGHLSAGSAQRAAQMAGSAGADVLQVHPSARDIAPSARSMRSQRSMRQTMG